MRTFLTIVALTLFALLSTSSAFAAEDPPHDNPAYLKILAQKGMTVRDKVKFLLEEYKGLAYANKQLKEAGASYQKSLTASTKDLSKYTDGEHQRMMSGVYTFDAAYSALFLRKKEMARFIDARKVLNEKLGFTAPLPPKMKNLLENPDSIQDFQAWTDALDEVSENFLTQRMKTKEEMDAFVDMAYGMVIEGAYIISESIALADYSPEMLALLNHQHDRIMFMMKLLNIFRGNKELEETIEYNERIYLLGEVSNLLMVSEFTQKEVDGLRELISPERLNILEGKGSVGSMLPFAPEPPKE